MCRRARFVRVSELRLDAEQGFKDHVFYCKLELVDVVTCLLQVLINVFQCPLKLRLVFCSEFFAVLVNGIISQVNEKVRAAASARRHVLLGGEPAKPFAIHKCDQIRFHLCH